MFTSSTRRSRKGHVVQLARLHPMETVLMSGPQLTTATTRARNRVEKCKRHANGQYAVDVCPLCPPSKRERKEPVVPPKAAKLKRRVELQDAVLAIIAECSPETHRELADLVKKRIGRDCGASNAAQVLDRLRHQGHTAFAVKIPREREVAT